MTYKYLKLALVITLLSGCYKTEKSLLEDVTESKYKAVICESSCDLQINNLDDAVAKAKIAGVSEGQILAALDFGQVKADRELARLGEIRKNEILKEEAELKNKCMLDNKVVCDDKCCSQEEYSAAVAAADAAADATAAADAATAIDAATSLAESTTDNSYFSRLMERKQQAETSDYNLANKAELQVTINQGMEYGQARKILMDSGWQAVTANKLPNGTPVCYLVATMQDWSYQNDKACEYNEIDACSGTGMGFCKMMFHDGYKTFLSVITSGGSPPEAVIHEWSKEQNYESNTITLDDVSNYKN